MSTRRRVVETQPDETPEPTFVRFADGRSVHLLRDLAIFDPYLTADRSGYRPGRGGDHPGLLRQRSLCGAVAPTGGLFGVTTFPDNDLCRRCFHLWPHGTNALFEHPTERADRDRYEP